MDEAMIESIIRGVISEMELGQKAENRNKTVSATGGKGLFSFGDHRGNNSDIQKSTISIEKNDQKIEGDAGEKRPQARSVKRFLEEIGLFMMNSHVWIKHEYRRRSDLEQRLIGEVFGTFNGTFNVQVFAGESLYHTTDDLSFDPFLPAIKKGIESATGSMEQPFFIKSVKIAVLNDANHLQDPKICVVLIGDEPRLIRSRRLNIFLVFDPGLASGDIYGEAFCNIYDGSIDMIGTEEFTEQLLSRICGR